MDDAIYNESNRNGTSEVIMKRAPLLVLGVAIAMWALFGAVVWFRLTRPYDGARLEPGQPVWKPDGIVVMPLEETLGGLHKGDIVIAVAGQSVESWAKMLVRPDVPRPDWQFGQTVVYTVLRNGN